MVACEHWKSRVRVDEGKAIDEHEEKEIPLKDEKITGYDVR